MTHEVPVAVRHEGAKAIVDLETDNVDFRNADMLKSTLTDLVHAGNKNIVLNLAHVNFMDSSGLSLLLTGKRLAEEVGGTFSICGLQGYVSNLIALTNLNKTLTVYVDDLEAIKS
jgi:anti-sigma B factor antagonist